VKAAQVSTPGWNVSVLVLFWGWNLPRSGQNLIWLFVLWRPQTQYCPSPHPARRCYLSPAHQSNFIGIALSIQATQEF
jgi:hypothetical protein